MFVDASALLAMMLDEDEARILAARLQSAATRLTSPLAVFAAIAGLREALGLPPDDSEAAVARFLALTGIKVTSVPPAAASLAAGALARFGPALGPALGPSECLAYALARYYRLPLLHRNAVFTATDLESA